ncbi:AAA family ATPase [Pseudobutyrivibrio sp. MD2005]|uniref:AAA family ATPase n=1 Tax=Pseudobutyrivibrio sp. MD2005 TaxID=1410616 RepID=UPI000686BD14|nr:AAA family ATPase [Pseudobutyrivibrio sp. MD2005]
MQFFKITALMNEADIEKNINQEKKNSQLSLQEFMRNLSKQCETYTEAFIEKGYLFISEGRHGDCCEMGMVIRENLDVEDIVKRFFAMNGFKLESLEIKETTFFEFNIMLHKAYGDGFVISADDLLREFNLDSISTIFGGRRIRNSFAEDIISDIDKETIYKLAGTYFTRETFMPELDRIFASQQNKYILGHPVDYMIESDDDHTQEGMKKLLLQALYKARRINNRRYVEVDLNGSVEFSKRWIESLYCSCVGGTVILNMDDACDDEDDEISSDYYYMEDLCNVIRRHSSDVLTIISMPRESKRLQLKIFEHIGMLSFVEIKEELVFNDDAVSYLKKRAKEYTIRVDKKLVSMIEEEHGYLIPELNGLFDEWYNQKLKQTIYSQYKDINCAKTEIKNKKIKGSAYEELNSMIGLQAAKKVINQALDCYKAQKVFCDKGLRPESICNHMIFSGNPGTAKTTVARLFARILRDNEIISKGHIVEVGRADLVGKYVGWTAPNIKKVFRQASGGVLFIDEAYSLVDNRNGSYGDEAINTIVQEMENHRDDVIVIFAGYPDKMEEFLDKNPGLRSRIAHYVQFEDYTTEELCQIAEFEAAKKGLSFDNSAKNKIRDIMENVRDQVDFGNGRYARNLVEKAKMAQNSRLVHMDYEAVTSDDVKRICEDDIEAPVTSKKITRRIGFSLA